MSYRRSVAPQAFLSRLFSEYLRPAMLSQRLRSLWGNLADSPQWARLASLASRLASRLAAHLVRLFNPNLLQGNPFARRSGEAPARSRQSRTPASFSWERAWHQYQGPGGWLMLATAALALLLWNWKLWLAMSVGIGVMMAVYLLQSRDALAQLDRWLTQLQSWGQGPQRLLALSVGTGGAAMVGTYMTTSIWADGSPWVASGLLIEGLGLVGMLLFVVVQGLRQRGDRLDSHLDSALGQLTEPQSLKRLLAVQQIQRLQERGRLNPAQALTVQRALELTLHDEGETVVREAILDCFPKGLPLQLKPRR
jgi:hypothetical protein